MIASGHVYFLHCPDTGYIKIGCTQNLDRRLRELKSRIAGNVKYIQTVKAADMRGLETALHRHYDEHKRGGELFAIRVTSIDRALAEVSA